MRRVTGLLVFLLIVGVLLVVADRFAVRAVEATVATRLAEAGGLPREPQVDVRGTPFLTQALRGRYDDVVVQAADVPAGTLRVSSFTASLRGVEVPLSDAVRGDVVEVPVEALSARAVLSYEQLTAAVADRGLRVSYAGDGRARVTGSVTVLRQTLEASAVSTAVLDGSTVVVTAERFEVGAALADSVLSRALGNRLDFRVEIGALPYGLALTGLRAAPEGVVLDASARDAVLRTP